MFGIVAYVGICIVVSVGLTFLYVMTRPLRLRDEVKSWKILANVLVVALILPYATCEILTATVGKQMRPVVVETLDEAGFHGNFGYYKVTFYTGSNAKVVAVGTEKADWGGTDNIVMAMNLVKKGNCWATDSYKWVNSDERDKEGFSFPPYR